MRICSLLPSATEILYLLGLEEAVVGVSHECDYPPAAQRKPRVIRNLIDSEHLSSGEIDAAVHQALQERRPLYEIDEDALVQAQPELIVTQELCEVCAVDGSLAAQAARALSRPPDILALHPHTLEEVLDEILVVAERTGRRSRGEQVIGELRQRLEAVSQSVAQSTERPRVFCLEWLNPLMASGHWVPQMVEWAGGQEVLGRPGQPSRYVTPEEVAVAQPDVVIVMPCGFSIARMRQELAALTGQAWWQALPAVRARQVYLVNGPAYFNRSGPRLIDGIELLEGILHPDRCEQYRSSDAVQLL